MYFTMEVNHNILRADLFRRQTGEDMQEFTKAFDAKVRESGCRLALICVRHSLPLFKSEHYAALTRLAGDGSVRVALVGDSEELRASHHYVELLNRQEGANVRGFNDEGSALGWLRNGEPRRSPTSQPLA